MYLKHVKVDNWMWLTFIQGSVTQQKKMPPILVLILTIKIWKLIEYPVNLGTTLVAIDLTGLGL
jgi:hypothetical protein